MKRSRFSEEQIIATLKEQETGQQTAHVCRKHGISSPTNYKKVEVLRAKGVRCSPSAGALAGERTAQESAGGSNARH